VATKSDLTTPSSSSLTTFTNGAGNFIDAVDANGNFAYLLGQLITLNNVIADQMPQLGVASVYTALQSFTTIAVNIINEATLNGDIVLDCNGSGKVRYLDGSSDTEIASKGYVAGVSFAAGNVPSGGTASTWLEGNGTWSDPRTFTPWTTRTINFNATDKGQYSINTGLNVQLPAPTATINFRIKPAIGQDFTATPSTLVRAGSEQIAGDAASFTMDVNAIYEITSNGTNWDVAITPIGRA
jgi:hypothetical protein